MGTPFSGNPKLPGESHMSYLHIARKNYRNLFVDYFPQIILNQESQAQPGSMCPVVDAYRIKSE